MSRFGFFFAGALALSLSVGCSDDSEPGSGMDAAPSFAADIHPILLAKCSGSGCHSNPNMFQPGHAAADVNEAYAATQATSASYGGPVYERILLRGSGTAAQGFMPPSCSGPVGAPGCLTVEEVALIRDWVEQGAPP
jgi:hypothetical protein